MNIIKLVHSLFSLLVGLPQRLFEFKNLFGLKSIQGHLLGQLLVQTRNSASELVIIRAELELLSQLIVLFVGICVLPLLFVQLLMESADFVLFGEEQLLEGGNLSVVVVSLLLLTV